jgi:transposase-like protein
MSSNDERPTEAGSDKPVVDWRRGAELLAKGLSVSETARQIGCSRSQLSRRRNHDQLFQEWIADFNTASSAPREQRLESLRERLHDAIDAEVQNGNVRVILWLADRLKLISPPEERTPTSPLDDLLQGMTEDDLKVFESLK